MSEELTDPEAREPWATLSTEEVHRNPWFHVTKEAFVTPNGNIGDYYVIHTKEKSRSVMIVPVDGGDILFARQYRYPTRHRNLEVPGGAVEGDDSVDTAARKELEEELGFSGTLRKIGEYCPWSGPLDEICAVYLATELSHIGQSPEETEDIVLERMNVSEAYRLLDDGGFFDAQTIAALSFARKYLLGKS